MLKYKHSNRIEYARHLLQLSISKFTNSAVFIQSEFTHMSDDTVSVCVGVSAWQRERKRASRTG